MTRIHVRKRQFKTVLYIIMVLFLACSAPRIINGNKVAAHPGNTASDGCHYCRTNCTKWGEVYGQRHCHGGYSEPEDSYQYDPPEPDHDIPDYIETTPEPPATDSAVQSLSTTNSDNTAEPITDEIDEENINGWWVLIGAMGVYGGIASIVAFIQGREKE